MLSNQTNVNFILPYSERLNSKKQQTKQHAGEDGRKGTLSFTVGGTTPGAATREISVANSQILKNVSTI